jgi:serine beta-lactamase-like protein LACTB
VAKRWNRIETWLTLALAGVGVVILGLGGLWIYMSTTPPLYPEAQSVPSVTNQPAVQKWAGAVERARQIVKTDLADQNLPGVSVAVGIDGELVWAEGFGFANLESRAKVAPETRFRVGNASIALTSAAAGLLLDRQQLELDEPIQTYVPEFPKKPWPVTLRQLMGHFSGLRGDGGDEGPLFGENCSRPVDALPFFAESELLFEPGTQYRFSSFNWIVVSAAIEAASKQSFMAFIQKEVFAPLRMDDTLADSVSQPMENQATSYFPRFAGDPRYGPDPMREVDYSCYSGASQFLSTPSDLVRFAMAINSGKVLQPATVQLLQSAQTLSTGQETGYGLGWDLENVTLSGKPQQSIGHDGELLGGIAGSLMTFRDRGLVVAIISNTSYADTPATAVKIAETFAPPTKQ